VADGVSPAKVSREAAGPTEAAPRAQSAAAPSPFPPIADYGFPPGDDQRIRGGELPGASNSRFAQGWVE
jgi:hypothetical protein